MMKMKRMSQKRWATGLTLLLCTFCTMAATVTDTTKTTVTGHAPVVGRITFDKKAVVGNTIRAVAQLSDQDGDVLAPTQFEWLRDGGAISGALTDMYTLKLEDAGHTLTVRVTPETNPGTTDPYQGVTVSQDLAVALPVVSVDRSSILADSHMEATLRLDFGGSVLMLNGKGVTFDVTGVSGTTVGTVTEDTTNGVFTAKLTGTIAGAAIVTPKVDGNSLGISTLVTVMRKPWPGIGFNSNNGDPILIVPFGSSGNFINLMGNGNGGPIKITVINGEGTYGWIKNNGAYGCSNSGDTFESVFQFIVSQDDTLSTAGGSVKMGIVCHSE